jgi:flagellar basal body-associated protein FliL
MDSDLLFDAEHMANIAQRSWQENNTAGGHAFFFLLWTTILLAGVYAACKRSSPASNDLGNNRHVVPIKSVLHLESFVVNLADPEESRYLRVGIDLGLENLIPAKQSVEVGALPTARIRDSILSVLTTWRSDALLAPEGKQKLKDELLHVLQDRVPELGVKEIYFTDFLVQR